MINLLFASSVSATFELVNNFAYYNETGFDVYLDDVLLLKDVKTNVFSIYDLSPNKEYKVKINNEEIKFTTLSVSETVVVNNVDNTGRVDVTEELQRYISNSNDNSLIVIPEGKYFITSLFLKSNRTIYLKKGAVLSASTLESAYNELPPTIIDENGYEICIGTWEGEEKVMKTSIINAFNVSNVLLVGEGIIDGNAQNSTWWINHKQKPYARPHMVYINHSDNVILQGITVKNSPQWTIHPFFSSNLKFLDLKIINPKVSPNTDGLNPQSCFNVDIIGVNFSVGDDCIAIKSGKIDMANKYKTPSRNITIRNCFMNDGHGGIVLGSEMAGGIKDLHVDRCYFYKTDRGLRIKTRRGRGKLAVIDGVTFSNIVMNGVLSPLVINMFYFCDPDGKTEYVYSKEKLPVDDRTPYLGKFVFKDLKCFNTEVCAGYFYGLPEMPIKEITIENCDFTYSENGIESEPAMMSFAEKLSKAGLVFYNVDTVNLKNVSISGNNGERIRISNVVNLYE